METRINQDEIIIGKYKTDTPNPSVASTYPRNSNGTVVVDANSSDIERRKLVVNLVGTRYSNTSFTEVLDTEFEEFLDPEIKVPDLETAQQADTSASKILELQAQLEAEKLKNNSNQAIIDQLQGAITNAQQLAISSIADEFAPSADDKKARIFSDNTLLRDKNDYNFFYIVEAGRKRRFIGDSRNDLVAIVAKSVGKLKPDKTVDFIEVGQDVLDDIPSGQPFRNFDLVKDKNTPALPPLTLPDGAQIVAKWVNPAPVTLQVTSDQLSNLTIDLDLQMTSAEGFVNYLYILDLPRNPNNQPDVSDWFPGRMPLVASSVVDAYEPNSIRRFTIPLKRTALDYNNQIPFPPNTALQPLILNATTPEITIPITAKLFNDTDGKGFSDTKYVTVKLAAKVPSLSNKTISAARTELAAQGLQLNVSSYTYTAQRSLDDRIITQDVPVNTALTPGSVINVTAHQYGRIVPDVSGKTIPQAAGTLRNNKLEIKAEYNGPATTNAAIIYANLRERNQINSQSPAAGSIVDDYTDITVYYTIY